MCGIVGYVGAPGDEQLVRRMADRIIHRGPDGEGYFTGDSVALGARRLSIIDLAGSNQPIFNEDRTVVTVFNGEIYNYRPLREHLEQKGHRLRTAGDTETLVHLYEEYGEAAVHLLRGMFGYAIWDAPRRKLVLVRDRVGIKPLYYTQHQGRLVFGSEIKSILAVPGIPREIDPEAFNAYLTLQYVPGPRTMLKGIRKLPPGHWLVWQDGQVHVEQYWDVVFDDDPPPMSERVAAEQLRAILEESVELHRISDVEVGVLLSGGIDSTAVTALLNRNGHRTRSFTVGFTTGAVGETAQARRVAEHIGTEHHELLIGPEIADVLPRLAWYQDEPVADAAAVPTYFICKFASEHLKVVLTGEGGDELLAGYPRYRWLHWSEHLLAQPAVASVASALGEPMAGLLPSTVASRVRAVVGGNSLADRHVRWIANMDGGLKRGLVHPDMAAVMEQESPVRDIGAWLARAGSTQPVSKLMYADFKTWLPDNILTKMDRMSMAASVEGRVPLLDHKVVEFAATLPYRLKLSGRQTKRLLRSAVKGLVSPELLESPKTAFRVPMAEWLAGPLAPMLRDTFASTRMRQRGLFEATALETLLAGGGAAAPNRAIWNILWLELWCQQYLDANTAAER
ncbi:MAG: asparagine synthase (glutamine-hydrolyzing) [Vicinamibacterales bacterium]